MFCIVYCKSQFLHAPISDGHSHLVACWPEKVDLNPMRRGKWSENRGGGLLYNTYTCRQTYEQLALTDATCFVKWLTTTLPHLDVDQLSLSLRGSQIEHVWGKTGVTADRDKIEFRLFNSSSIFNITLREELFFLPKNKPNMLPCPGFMVLVTWVKFLKEKCFSSSVSLSLALSLSPSMYALSVL